MRSSHTPTATHLLSPELPADCEFQPQESGQRGFLLSPPVTGNWGARGCPSTGCYPEQLAAIWFCPPEESWVPAGTVCQTLSGTFNTPRRCAPATCTATGRGGCTHPQELGRNRKKIKFWNPVSKCCLTLYRTCYSPTTFAALAASEILI